MISSSFYEEIEITIVKHMKGLTWIQQYNLLVTGQIYTPHNKLQRKNNNGYCNHKRPNQTLLGGYDEPP